MKALKFLPVLFLLAAASFAKDKDVVMTWPETGAAVLRVTIGRLDQTGSLGKQNSYLAETTVENLSEKPVKLASFELYLFDKKKVRIGDGYLTVNNLGPHQSLKLSIPFHSLGTPASIVMAAQNSPAVSRTPKTVSVRVYTIPSGATIKLDGKEVGVTPKLVQFTVGDHLLEFTKEGFAPGKFPFDVGPDDLPGGTISFELSGLSQDTLELRDGTTILGDLLSVSVTDVVFRINGKDQTYGRNQVKRITLTQLDYFPQSAPAAK
jgi:hypothetical protein